MQDEFEQQLLLPPPALEVRIRMGFVPERDHAQVLVELLDPSTRVLLAQWSRHHVSLRDWPAALDQAVQKANEYVDHNVEPF